MRWGKYYLLLPKILKNMIQQARYNKKVWDIVEDHYGTLSEFARDMKITHKTARKYMVDPRSMRIDFVQKLSRKIGKNIIPVISEGEE